jgi:head-tail adaptor
MKPEIYFDPDKVAYYEKAGWEAYYDRDWMRVFNLMVALNREQFHMSLLTALMAAVDIVRASIAFAPVDNDVPKATEYLRRYYQKARRAAKLQADAGTLARLEMDYWVVHRKLAIERKQHPDLENIAPMIESLNNLHAALFGISGQAAHRSAALRALAAKTVDRITGRYSTDVENDWRQVESYLQQAYQAVLST